MMPLDAVIVFTRFYGSSLNSPSNSDHFTFLKFENRTNGSKVMILLAVNENSHCH